MTQSSNTQPTGPPHNIVIFGESGAGKSSIVNLLAGSNMADISSGAQGCTFESRPYDILIEDTAFRLHDTAGLDEGEAGRVPKDQAILQLWSLLRNLEDGVSLLILCMRAPRIKASVEQNWKLFNNILCQGRVPTVIAVTGLEDEEVMDNWWRRPENKEMFQKYNISPAGFACITASKGKFVHGRYKLQEEYDESGTKLRRVILDYHLVKPWRVERLQWFETVRETTYETRWCQEAIEHTTETRVYRDVQRLINECEMLPEEAEKLAKMFEKVK